MSEQFDTIFDYIKNHDDTFAERPFCNADAAVLCSLTYLRLENIVRRPSLLSPAMPLGSLAISERISLMMKNMYNNPRAKEVLPLAAASRRFGDIKVNYVESRFSEQEENQFAAATYFLSDDTAFVAFRGTDGTITGWRENFNMAYKSIVPAQADAVEYLEKIARLTRLPLRVGGHSKGGNLAVYASMNCSGRAQERIIDIYTLDGPGFKKMLFEENEYLRIKDRIHKILPVDSLIGTLLNQSTDFHVIESDGEGFDQHSLYNWKFDGADFKYTSTLSDNAIRFDKTLDNWVASLSDSQLEGIVEALFGIINSYDVITLDDALEHLADDDFDAFKAYKAIDPAYRKHALTVLSALARAYMKARHDIAKK